MLVRLTKKLADVVNGIDLRHCHEGDIVEMPKHHAELLIAEAWADAVAQEQVIDCSPVLRTGQREVAADVRSARRDDTGVVPTVNEFDNPISRSAK
jgi:hypothetical protein